MPKVSQCLKAVSRSTRWASRQRTGGVEDHGTVEEDGPVTREALVFLSHERDLEEPRTQPPSVSAVIERTGGRAKKSAQ